MSKEKKKSIIFIVILSILLLALLTIFVFNELKTNGIITGKDTNEIMNDFKDYYNKKERTIIYYASTNCGYCELQTPILETLAEDYDLDYVYIDSSKLPNKQREEILNKLDIEHATPTTVIVENGKVIDKAIGYTQGKEYVEFFVKNKILPEDAKYSKEANLTFIDYSQYEELVSTDDTNIIVIGQTTCSHCIAIKPALNSIAGDYNLKINYLNLTEMSEDEYQNLVISLKDIEYNDEDFVERGSFGTPLTLIIKEGKVDSYISGERSKSQLVKAFKKANLIEE